MKRTGISKKLRFDVFKRDGFVCQYCGEHPPQVVLEIDHIDPVANGGTNAIDNLITACEGCNRGKGARLLSNVPEGLKEKAARIAEQEAQIKGYQDILRSRDDRIRQEAWNIVYDLNIDTIGQDGYHEVDKAWFVSIKTFIVKLGFYNVKKAVDIANGKSLRYQDARFRYFCGVCWSFVRDQEESTTADRGTQSVKKGRSQ